MVPETFVQKPTFYPTTNVFLCTLGMKAFVKVFCQLLLAVSFCFDTFFSIDYSKFAPYS